MTTQSKRSVINLAIAKDLKDIAKIILESDVTTVIAPPGSGKTLGIPLILSAIPYADRHPYIIVSVPTVSAVLNAYINEKALLEGSSIKVGYASKMDKLYNGETNIIYMTAGYLAGLILGRFESGKVKDINLCDILIIDEYHLGTLDNTFIISLIIEASKRNVQTPRVVLMSATEGPNPLEDITLYYSKYPVKLPRYPVVMNYISQGINVYHSILELLIELIENDKSDTNILVFVPGKGQIHDLTRKLGERVTDVEIIGASSETDPNILADIMTKSEKRRVIIGTNILETSITIPNLKYVIDSMFEKVQSTNDIGAPRLETKYVSQSSAIQRAGRVGREMAGIVYRMCSEEFYNNLDKVRTPEIERVPIHSMIIKLIKAGLTDLKEVITGVGESRLNKTLGELRKLEAIGLNYEITKLGNFIADLPLSVRAGTILYYWLTEFIKGKTEYNPYIGIVIVCLVDTYHPSYFWRPQMQKGEDFTSYANRMKVYKETYFNKFLDTDELRTILNMWNILNGETFLEKKAVKKFCVDNSLNYKKVKEAIGNINIVEKNVAHFFNIKISYVDTFGVQKAMEKITPLYERVFRVLEKSHHDQYQYKSIGYTLDHNILTYDTTIRYQRLIALNTFSIEMKNPNPTLNTKYFVSLCIPTLESAEKKIVRKTSMVKPMKEKKIELTTEEMKTLEDLL